MFCPAGDLHRIVPMASVHAVQTLLTLLIIIATVRAQSGGLVNAGLGTNGNIGNVGSGLLGGATGNVAQAGGCAQGLVVVCVAGICSCVLPGAGVGDPVLQDFAGNHFEFFGEPGSFYNLYSDSANQINMKLIEGFVDGHNGTYMSAFGVAHRNFRVNVTLLGDDGDMTDSLEMSIWSVPAGTMDSKNVSQPAYLNFNLTLLAPPVGDVSEGIIGETLTAAVRDNYSKTYNIFVDPLSAEKPAENHVFDGKGLANDYRVSHMFGIDFEFNRFGVPAAVSPVSRRALQQLWSRFSSLSFPLTSSSALTQH